MAVSPDDELAALEKAGVRPLTWNHEEYPPRLKEIYDKPPVLFVKGAFTPEDERSVALIGTRNPSPYGR